jgi:hypothetical protein
MFTRCINFKDYKPAAIIVSFYSCDRLELKYRQNIYVKYHIYVPQTWASSLQLLTFEQRGQQNFDTAATLFYTLLKKIT